MQFTDEDVVFLRALRDDPGRIIMYLRRGVLRDDHEKPLLELNPSERAFQDHQQMKRKIIRLFCAACDDLTAEGICTTCRRSIEDDLQRIKAHDSV